MVIVIFVILQKQELEKLDLELHKYNTSIIVFDKNILKTTVIVDTVDDIHIKYIKELIINNTDMHINYIKTLIDEKQKLINLESDQYIYNEELIHSTEKNISNVVYLIKYLIVELREDKQLFITIIEQYINYIMDLIVEIPLKIRDKHTTYYTI